MEEKDGKEVISFRIEKALKDELTKIAAEQDRSVSKQIVSVLRRFVDEEKKNPQS